MFQSSAPQYQQPRSSAHDLTPPLSTPPSPVSPPPTPPSREPPTSPIYEVYEGPTFSHAGSVSSDDDEDESQRSPPAHGRRRTISSSDGSPVRGVPDPNAMVTRFDESIYAELSPDTPGE